MVRNSRAIAVVVSALVIISLAAALYGITRDNNEFESGTPVDPAVPAGEIEGMNWSGRPFKLSALTGKVILVTFGYTHCPDICPTTLYLLTNLKMQLGEAAKDLEVVFVTVDPARDRLEVLASYVPHFDRAFHAVVMQPQRLRESAQAYGVVYERVLAPSSELGYFMDHSGTIFGIDRKQRLRVRIPQGADPEALLNDVRRLLGEAPRTARAGSRPG